MSPWFFLVVVVVLAVVAYMAGRTHAPAKRFGLAEFRRVAGSGRHAVASLVDGGVLPLTSPDYRLVAERAVVRVQVGTVEGLGYENVVSAEASAERDANAKMRAEASESIAAHVAAIQELEDQIASEEVDIERANGADDALDADLALLS